MTGLWLLPWLRGAKAYIYAASLVMMDPTREAAAAATVGEITAPPNRFSVMTHYPDASFRAVTRTGLDTLFAVAWADLDEEPLVLSVPDTGGRYYVIALFDMWSNVFALDRQAHHGNGRRQLPDRRSRLEGHAAPGVTETYRSPTRYVWVNGQMQVDGPDGRGSHERTSFTFLRYTFRPRGARRADGKMFTGFQPAVSPEALKKMSQQVRRWRIHTRTRHDLNELAALINPVVAG